VEGRSLLNESAGPCGRDDARDDIPGETERGLVALVLGVEVRRIVLLIEHPNHDPIECGNDRHGRPVKIRG